MPQAWRITSPNTPASFDKTSSHRNDGRKAPPVFFLNVRRSNDAQTRSVYAGGTSRLNDSGRHGSSFDDNSHGGFAPRMVATAAFTCAAIASSSTPLRGPYSRDCTARTAACTSRSMPCVASHSRRPRSRLRPPNAASNGCCACGGATFFCADAFFSTRRGRAERHHSASVGEYIDTEPTRIELLEHRELPQG